MVIDVGGGMEEKSTARSIMKAKNEIFLIIDVLWERLSNVHAVWSLMEGFLAYLCGA
jgi:hypothetical protein